MISRFTYVFIISILFLAGCTEENYLQPEKNPPGIGINNAVVLESRYLSHSGSTAKIEMDVAVVGSGQHADLVSLPFSAFKDTLFGSHQIDVTNVQSVQLNEQRRYSNLQMLDVSGNWDSEDAFNMRTLSLNKSIQDAKKERNTPFAISTFSRLFDGRSTFTVWVNSSGNGYNYEYDEYASILFAAANQNGATCNLYDALDAAIIYADENTGEDFTELTVVIRDYPDNQNVASIQDIISHARSKNVIINMIVLGDVFHWGMYSIAFRTGGFFNLVSSTSGYDLTLGALMDKGAPVLGSLHRLLSRNIHVYRLSIDITKPSGTWQSNDLLYYRYETNLNYSDGSPRLNNYLPIYVQIP
ncbi:hypothetical protein GYB22_03690 [bacterium]|nr:hypothetical protein [bacterium]